LHLIIILAICFLKTSISESPVLIDILIIRAVGQGQWITHLTNTTCDHYDFGGEKTTLRKNKKLFIQQCQRKKNRLHLSHSDYDHYSFYKLIIDSTKETCWVYKSAGFNDRQIKQQIPYCKIFENLHHKLISTSLFSKNKNDQSAIYSINNLLITGDASQKIEKKLMKYAKNDLSKVKFLILGHHGSRTSSHLQFLQELKNLKMAFVSARFKKYKHPHSVTVQNLKKIYVPLLRTEDWGHIAIY
jgi:competence protein ComEC